MQNLAQNAHPGQRIQKRFSKSASTTRSTKMINPTTNAKETMKKGGLSTTISAQMVELFSAFSMRHNHSRTITHDVSGMSMIHMLNGH